MEIVYSFHVMKITSRTKAEILRLTDALHDFNRGDTSTGAAVLQLADLTTEQIKRGLTERLKRELSYARSTNRRIPAHVYNMADRVLADADKPATTTVVFTFEMTVPTVEANAATSLVLQLEAQFVSRLVDKVPSAQFGLKPVTSH